LRGRGRFTLARQNASLFRLTSACQYRFLLIIQRASGASWQISKQASPGRIRPGLSLTWAPCARTLDSVLGQFCQALAVPFRRGDHLHLLPVVCEFFAAIEASYVGTRKGGRLRAAFGAANCDGKAVTRVSAAEKRFDQFCNHNPPSIPSGVCRTWVST